MKLKDMTFGQMPIQAGQLV